MDQAHTTCSVCWQLSYMHCNPTDTIPSRATAATGICIPDKGQITCTMGWGRGYGVFDFDWTDFNWSTERKIWSLPVDLDPDQYFHPDKVVYILLLSLLSIRRPHPDQKTIHDPGWEKCPPMTSVWIHLPKMRISAPGTQTVASASSDAKAPSFIE